MNLNQAFKVYAAKNATVYMLEGDHMEEKSQTFLVHGVKLHSHSLEMLSLKRKSSMKINKLQALGISFKGSDVWAWQFGGKI